MRQILGKSELPESFPGRRGQLSSPVNNPGLATYSTFCDKGHRRVTSFPRTQGRCPSWAWPRLQMPSRRGRGKNLPQFPPCCQGSLLSQAGLFGVWVVILGGDRPFSVVRHHCPSSCAQGARTERRPRGGLGLWLFLPLVPHWQGRRQRPSSKWVALVEGTRAHRFAFASALGDPGWGPAPSGQPANSAPSSHQTGSLRTITGCKLTWIN